MPFASIEDRRAYQRIYYRPYVLARYHRWRRAGACGVCGLPVAKFALCLKHRVKLAALKRRRRCSS